MQKLLTIVVPVYKVEPYINKCLDSCLIYKTNEQGEKVLDEELMNQLEVIIVNDGTPDNSAEMSREYVKRYPQTFRQIDKENGGHGSAWNVGLKEATGKYLRFLDSDDWLTNFTEFFKKLLICDADLVFTHLNHVFVEENKEGLWSLPGPFDEVTSIEELQLQHHYNCFTSFWMCTYKTSMLKSFYPLFAEYISYDDTMLYIAPLINAKTFVCYDLVLYQYLIGREGQSVSKAVVAKKVKNHIVAFQQFNGFWRVNKVENIVVQRIIDELTAKYCVWVWGQLTDSSYFASKGLKELYDMAPHQLKTFEQSKQVRMYKRLPLLLYWLYYKLGRFVNKSQLYRRLRHKG